MKRSQMKGSQMKGELLLKNKRTGLRDSWHTRQFVFDSSTRKLTYYQGQIFKGEKQVRGVNPRDDLRDAAHHRPHRFDFLLVGDNVLAVSAADAEIRRRWIDAIGAAEASGDGESAPRQAVASGGGTSVSTPAHVAAVDRTTSDVVIKSQPKGGMFEFEDKGELRCRVLRRKLYVRSVSWSPNAEQIAIGGREEHVSVVNAHTGVEEKRFDQACKGCVHSVVFAPNGKYLAYGGKSKKVAIYDVSNGQEIWLSPELGYVIFSIAWSSDSARLAVGGAHEGLLVSDDAHSHVVSVQIFDVHKGAEVVKLERPRTNGAVYSVAWSPDDTHVAFGGADKRVHLYEISNDLHYTLNQPRADEICSVAWSPSGEHLAVGGQDNQVAIYDWSSDEVVFLLERTAAVHSVSWSQRGEQLAVGGCDYKAAVYDFKTGAELDSFERKGFVLDVAWSPRDRRLAVVGWDNSVAMIDMQTGATSAELLDFGCEHEVMSIAWSPRGDNQTSLLAIGCKDGTAAVYNTITKEELHKDLFAHNKSVRCITWSPKGKYLAVGGDGMDEHDGHAAVFDFESGREFLSGHFRRKGSVRSIAWSPDEAHLAVAGFDTYAAVYEFETGQKLCEFDGGDKLRDVAWSPKPGTALLAVCGSNNRGVVYNISSKCPVHSFESNGWLRCVVWSPDGTKLALGGNDKGAAVFNVATEKQVFLLKPPRDKDVSSEDDSSFTADIDETTAPKRPSACKLFVDGKRTDGISGMAFSPDGSLLAVGWYSDKVTVYDMDGSNPKLSWASRASFTGTPYAVAFSPDGKKLAAGGGNVVQLIDAMHGKAMTPHIQTMLDVHTNFPDEFKSLVRSATAQYPGTIFASDDQGDTLLHHAVRNDFLGPVLEGLSESVKPRTLALIENNKGDTALGLALQENKEVMVERLVDAIAVRGQPQLRKKFAKDHLVQLIIKYPRIAKQLFDKMGLEPSGAHVAFADKRAKVGSAHIRGSTAALPSNLKCSGRKKEQKHGWERTCSRHIDTSSDTHYMFQWWRRIVSNKQNRAIEVTVEAKVLGLEGITSDPKVLQALCTTPYTPLFEARGVQLVLKYHWEKQHFFVSMVMLLCYLVLLILFVSWLLCVRDPAMSTTARSQDTADDSGTKTLAGFSLLVAIVLGFLEFIQLLGEQFPTLCSRSASTTPIDDSDACHTTNDDKSEKRCPVSRIVIETWLQRQSWNMINCVCSLLMIALVCAWIDSGFEPIYADSAKSRVAAVTALLAYIKLLGYLRAFRALAAFVALLSEACSAIIPFLTIFIVVIFGFGTAFGMLGSFERYFFQAFLLVTNPDALTDEILIGRVGDDFRPYRALMLMMCIVLVLIVMMSLLIAIISDSFERAQEKADAQFHHERARLIHANNALLDKLCIFRSREGEVECRWLHVLDAEEGDQGVDIRDCKGIRQHARLTAASVVQQITEDNTTAIAGLQDIIDTETEQLASTLKANSAALKDDFAKLENDFKKDKVALKNDNERLKAELKANNEKLERIIEMLSNTRQSESLGR